jgi:site-specific recombinase XerD
MKAIIRAILLDPDARSCSNGNEIDFGALREPFIRYMQINKAFDASTTSGNYRNDMDYINRFVQQKPLTSPSVFNFFQQDYQPIGGIEQAGLVAPEFQITNAQTIQGYVNALYRFVIQENVADEYDLYTLEDDQTYQDEVSTIDLDDELFLTENNKLHILLDRLNLLLAQGRLTPSSIDIIKKVLLELPATTTIEKRERVKLGIYLIMSSPE